MRGSYFLPVVRQIVINCREVLAQAPATKFSRKDHSLEWSFLVCAQAHHYVQFAVQERIPSSHIFGPSSLEDGPFLFLIHA